MKRLFGIITALTLAMFVVAAYVPALAEQGGSPAGSGFTQGGWTLHFTSVTDNRDVIQSELSSNVTLVDNPGYKVIRLMMRVPAECGRQNTDDLKVSLLDGTGSEYTFGVSTAYGVPITKLSYLYMVPDSLSYDGLTVRVFVGGQEAYNSTLAELITRIKAGELDPASLISVGDITLSLVPQETLDVLPDDEPVSRALINKLSKMSVLFVPGSDVTDMGQARGSLEYSGTHAVFAYESGLSELATKDALEAFAGKTILKTSDSIDYVQTMFITKDYCCFVYKNGFYGKSDLYVIKDGESVYLSTNPSP